MENSENGPSEKGLLPEALRGIVETHAEMLISELETDHLPEDCKLNSLKDTMKYFELILTNFWFNMQRAFEQLPDPVEEIPPYNADNQKTPREDLIDICAGNILDHISDLQNDPNQLVREIRAEIQDLLERVVEAMV